MDGRLPELSNSGRAVSTPLEDQVRKKEREIIELKQQIEDMKADHRGRAAPLDESAFVPRSPHSAREPYRSPAMKSAAPAPPATARTPNGRPSPNKGGQVVPHSPGSENEHPLKKEYREIQESAMRWVTTDQPFIRGRNGKGINMCDDISEDFFRSLQNQATFNLPKELRHSLNMCKESHDKMHESLEVLAHSQTVVDKSSADTLVDIRNDFELSRDRLKNKQLYFTNEVKQYREEMCHKIDTELSIVGLLIRTLEDSIVKANHVLERNLHPDEDGDTEEQSTRRNVSIDDIRNEYTEWRRQVMPTLAKLVGQSVAQKAAEVLSHEKGAEVHEIISGLRGTLETAVTKAKGTEDRLNRHKIEMQMMCDEMIKEMDGDFQLFGVKLREKEDDTVQELHNYKEDTTAKITANTLTVNNYQAVLADHIEYATKQLGKGNDYQMFRQAKEMKNQMVMMYAELAKMRLQYDGIMFQLSSSEFDVPIEYIGTLMNASTRRPVDWSPTANRQRSKTMMTAKDILTREEARMLRDLFNQYDDDGSGSIEAKELVGLWKQIWPWATDSEIQKVTNSIVQSVDKDLTGTIEFEEFMKIIEMSKVSSGGGAFRAWHG